MKDTVICLHHLSYSPETTYTLMAARIQVQGNSTHTSYSFPLPLTKLLKNQQANSSFLRHSDHWENKENNSQIPEHEHYLDGKKNLVFLCATQGDLTFEEFSSSDPCHSGYKLEYCWSYFKQTNSAYQHQNHIHTQLVIKGIRYVFFTFALSLFFSFVYHSILIDLQMLDTPQKW